MRCLDLYLNGRKLARAGVRDSGVVTASFSLINVSPEEAKLFGEEGADSHAFLVGSESPGVGAVEGKRLTWMDQPIQVGDEFRLVIVESEHRDEAPQVDEMKETLAVAFAQGGQGYVRALISVVAYVLHTDSRFAALGPGGSFEELREAVPLGPVPPTLRSEIVAFAVNRLVDAGAAEAVGEHHVRLVPQPPR